MGWTTAATGVTRPPARTAAPPTPSPAGRPTSACPATSCAMGGPTAGTDGTRLDRRVVRLHPARRRLRRARRPSFTVETGAASARPGGVTTHQTALMAATRTTVVSDRVWLLLLTLAKPKEICVKYAIEKGQSCANNSLYFGFEPYFDVIWAIKSNKGNSQLYCIHRMLYY